MATSNGVAENAPEPAFPPISGDGDNGVTEISSLCMNCENEGMTKFLFIKIPFYREVILSSFICSHCSYSNNEIQSAGALQEKGITISLAVKNLDDLNRQVVRTDCATVSIPELEFEIPPSSQKGTLSTIEGIIQRAIEGLEQQQPARKEVQPELAQQIEVFIGKLKKLLTVDEPFTLLVDDPSGNSFVENPNAPSVDPNLTIRYFIRTLAHDKLLGLKADDESESSKDAPPQENNELDLNNEVLTFNTNCPGCGIPCQTNMKSVKIPFFKEVIIMATQCDSCGHRSNEVKSGTGFEPRGRRMTLKVIDPVDLSRDVLKSETCSVEIPELEIETGGMSISGKFTTVEGLVLDMKKMMVDANPFVGGDSARSKKLIETGEKLDELAAGKYPFTLILDDPNSNSFIQDIYVPEPDPNLSQEDYERTYEQNEVLGLNDMKTENYC